MTHRQFASLAHKMKAGDLLGEIQANGYFNQLKPTAKLDLTTVEKWLRNSWNTESVLGQNQNIIANTGQPFVMQWAFPQAYYAAFTSTLALYKAVGFTQESHTGVLNYFGQLVSENKMPAAISFYSTGPKPKITYGNIVKPQGIEVIAFDPSDSATIDNQICQFLKSTRENKLDDKVPDFKFKNAAGGPRKILNPAMWQTVSDKVGNTTILDLLYRKRIKANYQNIDTFSATPFKAAEVLNNLLIVNDRICLTMEAYIAKAIGIQIYEPMVTGYATKITGGNVINRLGEIKQIVK